MTSNIPDLMTAYDTLQRALAQLQALDADKIESANLVPMVKSIQAIAEYAGKIDAQIQTRAVGNNELLPGVIVKTRTTHRKWSDADAAEQLAQECVGDEAFEPRKLKSPAQVEKLGDKGKQFVAVASVKPEGDKVAVY